MLELNANMKEAGIGEENLFKAIKLPFHQYVALVCKARETYDEDAVDALSKYLGIEIEDIYYDDNDDEDDNEYATVIYSKVYNRLKKGTRIRFREGEDAWKIFVLTTDWTDFGTGSNFGMETGSYKAICEITGKEVYIPQIYIDDEDCEIVE